MTRDQLDLEQLRLPIAQMDANNLKHARRLIENREFSLARAFYPQPLGSQEFIVFCPYRNEAEERAWSYALDNWGQPIGMEIYPRNYVRKARRMLLQGRVC